MRQPSKGHRDEPPILLVKWYHVTKWLLERVDSFPKNQRFIFGQRLADRAMSILEVLVEAAYTHRKADLLAKVNRDIEVLRWLVRMGTDRKVLTPRQYEYCCVALNECGRMVGGWWKQATKKERAVDAPPGRPTTRRSCSSAWGWPCRPAWTSPTKREGDVVKISWRS